MRGSKEILKEPIKENILREWSPNIGAVWAYLEHLRRGKTLQVSWLARTVRSCSPSKIRRNRSISLCNKEWDKKELQLFKGNAGGKRGSDEGGAEEGQSFSLSGVADEKRRDRKEWR